MDNICKICGGELTGDHPWKKHGIKQSNYFELYYPRISKLGTQIKFKSKEQYFEAQFNDKKELASYIKQNPTLSKAYIVEYLKNRKDNNKNIYLPSYFESKTLMLPSVSYIQNNICRYNSLADETQLKIRFNYDIQELEFIKSLRGQKIFRDTREQKGLIVKGVKRENKALKFADYSCSRDKFNLFIERKSLNDLISSVTSGYDRLSREFDKAVEASSYIIILIECTLSDLAGFKYNGKFRARVKFGEDFVFFRMRELMQKYSNIQFLFSGDRNKSVKFINLVYRCKTDPGLYDWQFLLDNKIITL